MAGVEGQNSGQMTEAELDMKKMWCHIWYEGTVPPRLRLFMWKLAHGALPLCKLMSERLRRGNPMCVECGSGEEDAEHMALRCPFARSCWFSSDLGLRTDGLPQSIQETLIWMTKQLTEEDWSSFIACCWAIWRSRNDCVFQGKMPGRGTFIKYRYSIQLENLIASSAKKKIDSNEGNRSSYISDLGDWVCHVDGSWAFGWVGGAGWMMTVRGNLHAYRMKRTVVCCAIQAEAYALLGAIQFARREGIAACHFLTDCKVLVEAFSGLQPPMEMDWRAYKETFEIWKLLKMNPGFQCSHK